MLIADRMKKIDSSGIRKVFDLAAKMDDPINFSIGQPDFDIPESIKQEAINSISEGFNRYTQTAGMPELIEKLSARLKHAKKASFEQLMITSGVSGGLMLAFMALINPGDEVIIPDPYFVMYKHLVNLMGGIPRYLDTYPDFNIQASSLEALITPKTKLLLLNSPANPTGKVYTRKELEVILNIADKNGLFVISDEIYDEFFYGDDFVSPASLYPNSLLLGGFSKTYAMTGWRIGYAAGPASLINEMIKLQQYTFVCAPSFAQKASVVALDVDMSTYVNQYRIKRDIIFNGLKDNFHLIKPEGAFYAFPLLPEHVDASQFVEKAIAHNLLVIPGNVFSEKNRGFRISFATSDEKLKAGVAILNNLAQEF